MMFYPAGQATRSQGAANVNVKSRGEYETAEFADDDLFRGAQMKKQYIGAGPRWNGGNRIAICLRHGRVYYSCLDGAATDGGSSGTNTW